MAIADLKNVLKIFGGSDVGEEQQNTLYKEALLMTLARAVNADVAIHHVEVDRVVDILKEHTGEEFSTKDIRVAARAELYAEADLKRYLSSVKGKLTDEQRAHVIQALADVFEVDEDISVLEVDFFNNIANTLGVTPAQIAGLHAGPVQSK
jgi:uncharacterized tellurite resistance protein B-like protein